jgi:Heterokaryon incompatibility protein (HET)
MLFLKSAKGQHLPRYEYKALEAVDDIRLVEIQPNSSPSSHIDCTLRTTRLSNLDRSYQCLSYVWGPAGQCKSVQCNNRTLPVTDNLYIALKNLRHKKDPITIWIDQISINQADVAERARQVLLMADIYGKAEKTIIWLGESADGSDLAMKILQERGEKLMMEDLKNLLSNASSPNNFLTTKLGLPDLSHKAWAALRKLLKRPWFKRTWVRSLLCRSPFPNHQRDRLYEVPCQRAPVHTIV